MTENAEDCTLLFFTLNMTENDNCKRYVEYEYVYSTVNYENKVNICLQFFFGHTHTRRNVNSCNFRSNLK